MTRAIVGMLLAAAFLIGGGLAVQAQEPLRDVVDRLVEAKRRENNISPAPVADDAAFLRRVYLDLCGTIPSYEEATRFLDDPAPDKRARLVDRLLNDPRYARQQADIWDMLYFGRRPPGYYAAQRPGFKRWLVAEFARNAPYDQIARALLIGAGNSSEQGSPMFLVQYQNQPEDATEKLTQVFLGVQLQCARCHDHPFEPWKQLDFYGMAAFLARVEVIDLGDANGEKRIALGEKNLGEVRFTGPAAEARPGQKGEPVRPKFLAGAELTEPMLPADFKEESFKSGTMPPPPGFSRKDALAAWVVSPENPWFARATANRVWAQFLGRGLVHPVDNMSPANTPSHPELLEELTRRLIESKFDLKGMIRELVNSQTYQLAGSGPVTDERPRWFERARTRPLSAEELVESWRVAVSFLAMDDKAQEHLDKGERMYPLGEYQTIFFGQPSDGRGDFNGATQEHLYMNNGGIERFLSEQPGGLLHALVKGEEPAAAKVERLYLSVLSRRPAAEESERFVTYVSVPPQEHPEQRWQEALWALLTCSEFRFNQ